jgi:formate/nitrite transporter
MAFKDPKAITEIATEKGIEKARLSWDKALVAGFLAGAYIAFAGLLAVVVSAGLDPETFGGLITLATGAVFTLGLILVVVAGSELLTGNMALLPLAQFRRRVTPAQLARNFTFVAIGNVLGALFVAYFLAVESGVVTQAAPLERLGQMAELKGATETSWEIFLRAIGCNWLVCLAVWMAFAADDIGGKILAIFFPIMGFVAMGFDHVVANMFFLPAAIFAGTGGIGWGDTLHNWLFAGLGNLVGAAVFVAGAYWYLYGRTPAAAPQPGDEEPGPGHEHDRDGFEPVGVSAENGGAARSASPR